MLPMLTFPAVCIYCLLQYGQAQQTTFAFRIFDSLPWQYRDYTHLVKAVKGLMLDFRKYAVKLNDSRKKMTNSWSKLLRAREREGGDEIQFLKNHWEKHFQVKLSLSLKWVWTRAIISFKSQLSYSKEDYRKFYQVQSQFSKKQFAV